MFTLEDELIMLVVIFTYGVKNNKLSMACLSTKTTSGLT